VPPEQFTDAFLMLLDHRAAHQTPLAKATMGLRSVVQTEGCTSARVSQRLKRVPTIMDKLMREPTMQLGNMQDIGGCRAVVENLDELRRVERRLKKNRPPVALFDYVESPRASGYRSVHVIITYDDRLIEVQLRTQVMHAWAIAVERLGGRLSEDLKSGRGPGAVLAFLGAASEAMALEEAGDSVDASLVTRIGQLRELADPFFRGDAA
jgi:putative GTP pyrophosphokinase